MNNTNEPLKGVCLCGAIEFNLSGVRPKLYQCHCSLCRKVSGSSANAAMWINHENFNWVKGETEISSFKTQSGFRSDFCKHCGSPVPNTLRDDTGYWVPAGLLDNTSSTSLIAHLYVDSKAHWDQIDDRCPHFKEMPEREELKKLLK